VVWQGSAGDRRPYADQSASQSPKSGKIDYGKIGVPDSKSTAWELFTDD
jgi:hypothetical protein